MNGRWRKLQFFIFGVDEHFNCFRAFIVDLVKFGAIAFVGEFIIGFLVRLKEFVFSEISDWDTFNVVSIINIKKSLYISF